VKDNWKLMILSVCYSSSWF